jgi:hypothetical protein
VSQKTRRTAARRPSFFEVTAAQLWRGVRALIPIGTFALWALSGPALAQSTYAETVRSAAIVSCRSPAAAPVGGAQRLPAPFGRLGPNAPEISEWSLANGLRLRLTTLGNGQRRLVYSDLYDGHRALLRAVADRNCRIIGGRGVVYDNVAGRTVPIVVRHLDPSLTRTVREIHVNPPVPKGAARTCLKVGLLDNGVNYTRPDIARRLAYRADGSLIGLDTWEMDGRPFDYGAPPAHPDPRRSIFNPRRHGTAVAGVLLRHAPASACIVPVRFRPFGADREVAQAVAFFADNGVRIVSIQSGRSAPWPALRRAIASNPGILFIVAAGNEGADLSRQARYPASYDLPNMLVVVGTDRTGTRLWSRSNHGSASLTIGYRAEGLNVALFDGTIRQLDGTSFSAPAVAGIAAQVLSQNPDITTRDLIAKLIQRARTQGATVGGVPVLP